MDADLPQPGDRRVDHWIFAWCALTSRTRRWQTLLEHALSPHQLVASELLVLWRIGHSTPAGISQVDLSRELSLSPAQVSGVVQSLQRRGWLLTMRPPEDRRRLICSLTSPGQAQLEQVVAALQPIAQRCLGEDDGGAQALIEEEAA